MTVYELDVYQIEELREEYFYQLCECGKAEKLGVESPSDIPDSVIYEHYSGTNFIADDFWCSQPIDYEAEERAERYYESSSINLIDDNDWDILDEENKED